MSLRVLIVPDKFKGTLTASGAAAAMSRGWHRARPADALELLPMSDGGDGFGEVMSDLIGAVAQSVKTYDAAHRQCTSKWWWHAKTRTAVIESARVIGLAMLPPGTYHPFELDTYGLGKVVRAAAKKRPLRLLVGLGGSATNDGGFGMARALGWEFRNEQGVILERWTELAKLTAMRRPADLLSGIEVIGAVDVQNPLLGPQGASRVYGPQKGLHAADFRLAERCLRRLASLVPRSRKSGLARIPGAGAAGGLGFGFAAFMDGRLEAGFELFAREVGLDRRLHKADLVLTGEGAIDRSTFMGKGAGEIARRCRDFGVPCLGLAGIAVSNFASRNLFTQMHGLTDLISARQAKAEPAEWLERLTAQVAGDWPVSRRRVPKE